MSIDGLTKLAALIESEREALLSRWRRQVRELPSARHLDTPTLNDHMPGLFDELIEALQSNSRQTIPEAIADGSPSSHGLQRAMEEFDIEEVVSEYNILRGCIHDLADDKGLNLQGEPFRVLNQVLDHAIGLAVKTYASKRALEIQQRREEYLAFLAHDLRTPLNVISLAGDVLARILPKADSSAGAERMVKALRRNVQQLDRLISKVIEESTNLQTSTGIKLERRECDLWPLVEALVQDFQPATETAKVRLINAVPDDMVVYADAGLLRRVIQNLIANAIKYAPSGEIIIGATELRVEGSAESAVECAVSDNGAGIPEELLTKIFDKGETDQENEGGTGLGLAIVKTFAEAHGGTVTVESKEGAGSTFRFLLPAKANAAASAG